jgi:hypothetical protein
MRYQPAPYPETIPQVVTRAWNLYLSTFFKVYALAFVIAILAFIPAFYVIGVAEGYFSVILPMFAFKTLIVITEIISLTIFLGILWCLQCVTVHKHESLKTDLTVAFKHLLQVIFAAILQGLLFSLIAICSKDFFILVASSALPRTPMGLFISGIPVMLAAGLCVVLFFLFIFYLPLILTENKNPIRALQRSMELVWGNWWRVFWTILTPWLTYVVLLFTIKALMNYTGFFEPGRPSLIKSFIYMLTFAVYLPWFASTLLVQLRDLELRQKVRGPRRPKNIKKPAKRSKRK